MDLDKYLWKYRMSAAKLARKVGVSSISMGYLRSRKRTPSLFLALKIYKITNGEVSLEEMLPLASVKELRSFDS